METYTTPVLLKCPVSGREQKLYNRPYIDSLIARYGSLEAVKASYIGKGVKRRTNIVDTQVVAAASAVVDPKHTINDGTFARKVTVRRAGFTEDGDECFCTVYESV